MRPLALLSTRRGGGLRRARDQLHFHDEKNDRFFFLHSEAHEWFFDGGMHAGDAVVFDSAATPHTSFSVLPQERCLHALREALLLRVRVTPGGGGGDGACTGPPPFARAGGACEPGQQAQMAPFVHAAIAAATELHGRACGDGDGGADGSGADGSGAVAEEVAAWAGNMTRASLEMRCLALTFEHWAAVVVTVATLAVLVATLAVLLYCLLVGLWIGLCEGWWRRRQQRATRATVAQAARAATRKED